MLSQTLDRPRSVGIVTAVETARSPSSLELLELRHRAEDLARAVRDELNIYADYEANWDGYGAQEFRAEVLDKAAVLTCFGLEVLLEEDIVPDRVTPGPCSDGAVEVEFEFGERLVSLLLDPDQGSLEVYRREGGRTLDERRYCRGFSRPLEGVFRWLACG